MTFLRFSNCLFNLPEFHRFSSFQNWWLQHRSRWQSLVNEKEKLNQMNKNDDDRLKMDLKAEEKKRKKKRPKFKLETIPVC